jgi:soluble lytic murein transglycosylase-like protein
MERQMEELYRTMKANEVQITILTRLAEESGLADLEDEIAALRSARQASKDSYDAYVRESGVYEQLLTREDTLIYETARSFGESEFEIDKDFIEAVHEYIRDYWLSAAGKSRFKDAVERAEASGFTREIVSALERRGVPAEFYYLALQESNFQVTAVGPQTRYGRAVGLWQLIPPVAERYGLKVDHLATDEEPRATDERFDFHLSTDAAARYLRDLYGTLTQASGLLVVAAFDWGEHRVAPRLEELSLPGEVFREQFADVPENPSSRSYWTFLREYEQQIPEEIQHHVIRVFSAAVIGRDPRHFGIEADNPLAPYVS